MWTQTILVHLCKDEGNWLENSLMRFIPKEQKFLAFNLACCIVFYLEFYSGGAKVSRLQIPHEQHEFQILIGSLETAKNGFPQNQGY